MIIEYGRAKINLTLDITGTRPDGFHEVSMIMQSIALADTVELAEISEGIKFEMDAGEISGGENVPVDETNLAYRAAIAMQKAAGKNFGVAINLKKKIPAAAGLAGGSTDAAAVIVGINKLFDLNFDKEKLCKIGAKLGSDIPFCIIGGTCLAEGRGEKLIRLPDFPKMSVILAKPHGEISTARAYKAYDENPAKFHPPTGEIINLLNSGNYDEAFKKFSNVMEPYAAGKYPIIENCKRKMLESGAKVALMSGSGPTVFGLFEDHAAAREAADALRRGEDAKQIFVTEFFGPYIG